jgi:hypothetical protein
MIHACFLPGKELAVKVLADQCWLCVCALLSHALQRSFNVEEFNQGREAIIKKIQHAPKKRCDYHVAVCAAHSHILDDSADNIVTELRL